MNNKSNFKKYVSLIVCSIFLALAFIGSSQTKVDVVLGKGNGTDSRVATMEQFIDVLDFFSNFELKSSQPDASPTPLAMLLNSEIEEDEKPKYTSATFYNKSKSSSTYSYSYQEKSSSASNSVTRELTVYLTQTSAYYKSAGCVMTRSTTSTDEETTSSSMIFNFDMEFYMTIDFVYIKFNEFDIIASGEDNADAPIGVITNEMLGKWFDAREVSETFLSINEENYEILSSLGEYFEENKDSDFTHSNNVYTLKKELWGDDMRGDFVVNLSNKTRPTIRLIQTYSKFVNNEYSMSQDASAENNMAFSNINNTIINFKEKTIYKISDFINEEDLW